MKTKIKNKYQRTCFNKARRKTIYTKNGNKTNQLSDKKFRQQHQWQTNQEE